eukprot:TRINITY_DN21366_c0_g1_i1.p1 TRINITY_DN21366_c0_g1~~TRINITY_DN21366_c0_g1_i1.p1  ORF type:complete len:244 (-),score=34.82 TRINITY_DN21366_c0_g1_i1:75-782(-)
MPVDYSRFDNIDTSDSETEQPDGRLPDIVPSAAPPVPRPPPNVLEDLEDYFERLDARRAELESDRESPPPSVERFAEEDLAALTPHTASEQGSECAICLSNFDSGEEVIQLPCAARHVFHAECAQSWLARNITCPLCRVDVRTLVRSAPAVAREAANPGVASSSSRSRSPSPQPSPRSFGYTRDGGVIMRYEPRPPLELQRPSYIPVELHPVAELVEIDYPDRGTARVWRVPRDS